MKVQRREGFALFLSVLFLLFCLTFLTRLTTPKQHDMGSTWGHFLEEPPNSLDILYLGSSLVYCDVVPAIIWEETGLTGYVMAGPEQPMPMTYYYLSEALKTQHPQAVFIEVTGMFYDRYTSFTKVNIGQMPWGYNRLLATLYEAEPDLRTGLLFPLLFYHDRWSILKSDDWKVTLNGYSTDPLAGYTWLNTYRPAGNVYQRPIESSPDNIARNYGFLHKLYALCMEEDIQPVFYFAPTMGRFPEELSNTLRRTITEDLPEALFLDCNEYATQINNDPAVDYYDTLHFNAAGAEKFSRFLSSWIEQNLSITSTHHQEHLWQSRADYFFELAQQPMQPAEK